MEGATDSEVARRSSRLSQGSPHLSDTEEVAQLKEQIKVERRSTLLAEARMQEAEVEAELAIEMVLEAEAEASAAPAAAAAAVAAAAAAAEQAVHSSSPSSFSSLSSLSSSSASARREDDAKQSDERSDELTFFRRISAQGQAALLPAEQLSQLEASMLQRSGQRSA